MKTWHKVVVAVLIVEARWGPIAEALDLLQGPATDAWCWAVDRGWLGE